MYDFIFFMIIHENADNAYTGPIWLKEEVYLQVLSEIWKHEMNNLLILFISCWIQNYYPD